MNERIKPKLIKNEKHALVGGGIAGFLLAYLPTQNILLGLLAGAPSGVAGICVALLLCKKCGLLAPTESRTDFHGDNKTTRPNSLTRVPPA